jgi:iron(III) transport system permease protein
LRTGGGWLVAACCVALLALLPVAALAFAAMGGDGSLWPHLLQNVLPAALKDTLLLLLGTGVLVVALGTGSAWLVTAYDFRGRRIFEWALLLPLAVPTYIMAYAWMDLLHPIGPLQTGLRSLLGLANPQDLRLPDLRSLPGCVLVLGFVLYPYVYLTTRAVFLMQASGLLEAARTLGQGPRAVFLRVALPMARPAIAVGTALALMEAINDIGASELLGVRTLTVSIYSTWVNRSDLAGAAQIALAMLAVVVVLLVIERLARRRQRYAGGAQKSRRMAPQRIGGSRAAAVAALLALPVLLGFVAPAGYLVAKAVERMRFAGFPPQLLEVTLDTLKLATLATAFTLLAAMAVIYALRLRPGGAAATFERIATLGYAIPGTVLGIGLLAPMGAADDLLASLIESVTGYVPGLLLLGTSVALVYAYSTRFLAVAAGNLEAGFTRIPAALDQAGRTLGATSSGVLGRIHLPLLRPALAAAALLVFVDCMKELPATLLLRPLDVETLATHLYAEAVRGTYEDGAIAALLILVAGLVPVILLSRVGAHAARKEHPEQAIAPLSGDSYAN